MSVESFFGLDQGEGMSESAFEAFKERMAAAQAQIAAIKKEEGKQKKKEDELVKILAHFVKTSHKTDLVLLISRALEENLPANFILSIILLGNKEVQQQVGQFLMIEKAPLGQIQGGGGNGGEYSEGADGGSDMHDHNQSYRSEQTYSEKSLTFFGAHDDSLPLKIKIELDQWLKNILFQADESPEKLVRQSYKITFIEEDGEFEYDDKKITEKRELKDVIFRLGAHILRDFLDQNEIKEEYEKLYGFTKFVLGGIIKKTEENLANRKLLER